MTLFRKKTLQISCIRLYYGTPISALEDQMNEVEEDGEEAVQGGPEVEDEDATEDDLVLDLSGVHVELVDSTH